MNGERNGVNQKVLIFNSCSSSIHGIFIIFLDSKYVIAFIREKPIKNKFLKFYCFLYMFLET